MSGHHSHSHSHAMTPASLDRAMMIGVSLNLVFVLVEFDENAGNAKLLAQIKADQELYDAIKVTDLVDEMEQKVDAYRQRMSSP